MTAFSSLARQSVSFSDEYFQVHPISKGVFLFFRGGRGVAGGSGMDGWAGPLATSAVPLPWVVSSEADLFIVMAPCPVALGGNHSVQAS